MKHFAKRKSSAPIASNVFKSLLFNVELPLKLTTKEYALTAFFGIVDSLIERKVQKLHHFRQIMDSGEGGGLICGVRHKQ